MLGVCRFFIKWGVSGVGGGRREAIVRIRCGKRRCCFNSLSTVCAGFDSGSLNVTLKALEGCKLGRRGPCRGSLYAVEGNFLVAVPGGWGDCSASGESFDLAPGTELVLCTFFVIELIHPTSVHSVLTFSGLRLTTGSY